MKTQIFVGTTVLLASSLLAAAPKDEVQNAVKKLGDASNYSWRSTSEMGGGGGGGRFRPGPTDGKAAKDGTICLTMTRGDNTTEAVMKGEKGAIKSDEGWQSLTEMAEGQPGQFNRGRFMARMLQNFKAPAVQAQDLVGRVKSLQKSADAYAGDLTPEGAEEMMRFRPRRGGGGGPEISNARGSVKFWIKDGVLSKYEYRVQGTMTFGGNERDIDRTTTVEIKDVGSTKIELPAEAKKKMS